MNRRDEWISLHETANETFKRIFSNRAECVAAPLPQAAMGQPGVTTTQDDGNAKEES
jgi:hypothetical protein